VKWGTDVRVNRDDLLQTQTFSPRGRFNFRAGTTALNGGGVSGFANSFASFLLDLPSDYGRDLALTFPEVRQKTLFSYVQDKWTVSQKLTLNFGLRHEIYFSPTPMFPGGFSNYNPPTNSLELAGIGGVPSNMGRRTNYKDFAPRFGFAYRVNEKTVVRGGYGISIDPSFPDDKYAFNYPVQQNNGFTGPNTYAAAGSMAAGFPSPLVASIPADGIITKTDPNSFYLSVPLDLRETYIQSWNLTVERALPGNFALSTAYVGNHAVGVLVQRNINAGSVFGTGAAGQPLNQLFGRKAETRTWVGTNVNYNALQVKLDRRFSNGFLLTTAYTYQKAINYADDNGGLLINSVPSLNRGRTGSDRTHTFVQSYIYELPFGPNKRWLHAGIARWVLGDWQVNGIFSDYSGLPLDIRISNSSLNTPGNINRPDMIGKPTILGGIGPGKKWFDVTAFGQPAPGKFGTTGRNILNGPKLVNIDLSLFRKFRVTERTNAEFRAESFNFANSPHFDRPQSTLGGTAFGEITSAMADHRLIQFGLKITF
jgi:hypothetical protein